MALHHPSPRRRGVSLIEALVALAVMAFGMLSLVGVQATMRLNSDLAKQRTEATRIASREVELLRAFTVMTPLAGQWSYDEIVADGPTDIVGGNATYRVNRSVNTLTDPPHKEVRVVVGWQDRAGTAQTVTLDTVIAAVDPVLSSQVSMPPQASAFNQVGGRQSTIPPEAVDLDGSRSGSSAFKPFNTGTVVWVFNNYTGVITSRCTGVNTAQSLIVTADLTTCVTVNGRLVSGEVRFDLRNPLNDVTASENPQGRTLPLHASNPLEFSTSFYQYKPAECIANSPLTELPAIKTPVAYYCLVFLADNNGWGGKLEVRLASQFAGPLELPNTITPGNYRVCRYTSKVPTGLDLEGDITSNADHPKTYCRVNELNIGNAPCTGAGDRVKENLAKQDFLVILATTPSCPLDDPATPLINGNTRPHQP